MGTLFKTVESAKPEDTQRLAEAIGRRLKGGEVIELVSDLGGGKTTFVGGLARGLGSTDAVASPTFTISRIYKSGRAELRHFDFYRLQVDAGLMRHELEEVIGDPDIIVVVEWGGIVEQVLPKERLAIVIEHTGERSRKLIFEYPEKLAYLTEGL